MSNHLLDLCGIRESLTSLPSDHELDLIIAAYDKAAATPNTLRDLRLDLANWRLRNQAPDRWSNVISALCKAKLALADWVPPPRDEPDGMKFEPYTPFHQRYFYSAIGRAMA